MVPVLQHAVNFVEKQDNKIVDWVLLLQPTDPLREVSDIENGLKLALEDDCDSIISVERVFAHHPILMKKIEKNRLLPFMIEEKEGTPRQEYTPPAYMRNGSIYLTKRNTLMENNSIWGNNIKPFVMKSGSRISIDSVNDLKLVEILLKKSDQ
jgi:CMP-N-acetylneuraminic acid synthetase